MNDNTIYLQFFEVLRNTFFKEHLPEDGHYRWQKYVEDYAVFTTINVYICICTFWFCFS